MYSIEERECLAFKVFISALSYGPFARHVYKKEHVFVVLNLVSAKLNSTKIFKKVIMLLTQKVIFCYPFYWHIYNKLVFSPHNTGEFCRTDWESTHFKLVVHAIKKGQIFAYWRHKCKDNLLLLHSQECFGHIHMYNLNTCSPVSIGAQCFLPLFCIVLKYISLMWNVFYSRAIE